MRGGDDDCVGGFGSEGIVDWLDGLEGRRRPHLGHVLVDTGIESDLDLILEELKLGVTTGSVICVFVSSGSTVVDEVIDGDRVDGGVGI